MSISQSPFYSVPSGPDTCKPHSNSLQSLHERRQNKKRRLETNRQQKPAQNSPYTPFFIPERLLKSNEKHVQPQSALLNLPNELLLLIVEHLSIPYFQVCLGLTCKRVASTLEQNRIRMSPWRGYLDKEGLYRLLTQPERVSRQRQLSLEGLAINSPPPIPSQPYIPTDLRLCRACFRHIPHDPIYWQRRMRNREFDAPGVNWFDITNFFEEGHRRCGQHKCPDCCVRGYTAFMNETKYKAALKEDKKDEDWGIDLDAEDGGRRVCPELSARLGRP